MSKKKDKLWFCYTWVKTDTWAKDREEARVKARKEIVDEISKGDFTVVVQEQ